MTLEADRTAARQRLAIVLRFASIVVLGLSVVATVAPAPIRRPAGWAAVFILVTLPVGRVAWLWWRWRRFDLTFARAAAALLASLTASALVGLVAR